MHRVMVALSIAVFLSSASLTAAEGGKRIGVVNVSRVFQASQKVKQIQERLKEQFEGKRVELEKKQAELRDDMNKAQIRQKNLQEGNAEQERKLFAEVQDIQGREFELKLQIREVGKQVEKVRMEEMKQVLKEIRAAIRDVGTSEKFDLIMRAPEYDDEGLPAVAAGADEEEAERAPKTAAELVRRFRENPVLYFEKTVDITEKVIEKLNADFQKAGGAAPKTK